MNISQFRIDLLQMATYIDVRLYDDLHQKFKTDDIILCSFLYSASPTLQVYASNILEGGKFVSTRTKSHASHTSNNFLIYFYGSINW